MKERIQDEVQRATGFIKTEGDMILWGATIVSPDVYEILKTEAKRQGISVNMVMHQMMTIGVQKFLGK